MRTRSPSTRGRGNRARVSARDRRSAGRGGPLDARSLGATSRAFRSFHADQAAACRAARLATESSSTSAAGSRLAKWTWRRGRFASDRARIARRRRSRRATSRASLPGRSVERRILHDRRNGVDERGRRALDALRRDAAMGARDRLRVFRWIARRNQAWRAAADGHRRDQAADVRRRDARRDGFAESVAASGRHQGFVGVRPRRFRAIGRAGRPSRRQRGNAGVLRRDRARPRAHRRGDEQRARRVRDDRGRRASGVARPRGAARSRASCSIGRFSTSPPQAARRGRFPRKRSRRCSPRSRRTTHAARPWLRGAIEQIFRDCGATTVRVALDRTTETELWELRHAASPILARLDPNLRSMQFIEDGAVPPANLPAYVRGVRAILLANETRGVIFGHAGDAHVHVNPLVDVGQPDWRDAGAPRFCTTSWR